MEKGFFGSLFDMSFTSFVTTKLVKVLYILSLVILGIAYIAIAIAFFSSGGDSVTVGPDGNLQTQSGGGHTGLGLLWLFVLGPLFLFFYTLLYRVFFELVVVLFRIFENTRDQLKVTQAAWPGAAAAVAPPPAPSLEPPGAPVSPV